MVLGATVLTFFAPARAPASPRTPEHARQRIAALEKRAGGRIGVAVLDTGNGRRIQHRAAERFPMCSTFKFLLAAAVLARIDHGQDRLDRWISYGERDLLDYAPVTKAHLEAGGMTVRDLCAAAVELSDNTAANLLLDTLGGPAELTRYVRSLGDATTRLDRTEPTLNSALPGDLRDTTSPAAMLSDMHALLVAAALSPTAQQQLLSWLMACKTGAHRLRAGLPAAWRVGDKTGTGDHGAANDIAIVRPPDRSPILIAAYFVGSSAAPTERERVLRDIGRIVAEAL